VGQSNPHPAALTSQVERLARYLRLHDSTLLLKAQAMVEAVRRGFCEAGSGA
jgi:hypothetical protein